MSARSIETMWQAVGFVPANLNAHWSPDAAYTHLNLADPTVAIPWPVPLERAEISDKDRSHPVLADVEPVPPVKTLIVGGGGQVGTALRRQFPQARAVGRSELDLAVPGAVEEFDFAGFDVVINAAAFTAVDEAETEQGRREAWAANASGVAALARAALAHGSTLVHYSTDYVFDGTEPQWAEDSPMAPINVYGQSKAAGDLAVSVVPRHYLIRTSWVIGEGHNFVRTMQRLVREGASPTVVDDQVGRLTFTDELARATAHLLAVQAPYGTYNVTNGGTPMSWYDVARLVFDADGRDPGDVVPVSTAERVTDDGKPVARRPLSSVLSLDRLEATGFVPAPADEEIRRYVRRSEPS